MRDAAGSLMTNAVPLMAGTSYCIDAMYVKVGTLYRALDKDGNTIEFMLSSKRDIIAAKCFLKKMMWADHRRLPFSISVDKHASYPDAFSCSQREKIIPFDCRLRRTKYLTNIVEQDHRFIRRRWREPGSASAHSTPRSRHWKGSRLYT